VNIQRYETADGWPGVRWEQDVPSGWTWHSVIRLVSWGLGGVLGLVVFISTWLSGTSLSWCLFWAGIATLALGAPDALNRFVAGLEGKQGGGPNLTDAERERLARWKVKQIYRTECWRAEVTLAAGRTLMFELHKEHPGEPGPTLRIPLQSFQTFEIGSEDEWFGDAAERELAHLTHKPAGWVIVAGVEGMGVAKIAHSGRDKAGITNLLLILTDEFVTKRKEFLHRLAA
jgi:hypothetical protein